MKDLRIVLCTGIDKESKLEVLKRAAGAAPRYGEGCTLHVYDVWDAMRAVAQEKGYVGRRETITQLPKRELSLLREAACRRTVDAFYEAVPTRGDRSAHVAVVVTRTLAPGPSGFLRTLDETHEVFDAEACITVTDNIERISEGLSRDPVWRSLGLPREQVLSLRQDEITNTEEWSKTNIAPGRHFLLAANEPPETLLGLLFSGVPAPGTSKRVYLSFPITHSDEDIRRRKAEFLARLRQTRIAFDPGSATEYDVALGAYLAAAPEEQAAAGRWLERLGPVTVDNDYRLISQSDGIVVYYPSTRIRVQSTSGEWVDAEQKVLSAGVIAEMIHAKNEQRTVHALWLSGRVPSPFFLRYCDPPLFQTEAEFFQALG